MDTELLIDILTRTIVDGRMSRGERKLLTSIARDQDDHGLDLMRHHVFEFARKQSETMETAPLLTWVESAVKAIDLGDEEDVVERSDAFFSPGSACRNKITSLLQNCRETMEVCVFTITDNQIADALIAADQRGVKIRVLTDDLKSQDAGSDVSRLKRMEIATRMDKTDNHMHHKFAIFDKTILLTGSYNWTRSAFEYNQENIVVTRDQRLRRAFSKEFERLWEKMR